MDVATKSVQPHRGGVILALGLAGIFFPVFALVAALMGEHDLASMDEGSMDPSGRANTQAGKTIGQLTILFWAGIIVLAIVAIGLGWRGLLPW